ncbi:MAG TPA: nuclear transport factor 2 family protein [Vicinamibacterales bacterium]
MTAIVISAWLAFVGAQADAATTLVDLEHRLARAWVERDRAFIDALLAPEWAVTDASGAVLTKQMVLEQTFASSERRIESMVIDDVKVRIFGEAAVVTGRTRASGSYQGQRATVTLRFTDVFVFRNGKWMIVASHGSSLAP